MYVDRKHIQKINNYGMYDDKEHIFLDNFLFLAVSDYVLFETARNEFENNKY